MNGNPIAFVDESGYVIPTPNFSEASRRYVKGRFIYTKEQLKEAMAQMEQRTRERRKLVDLDYGVVAGTVPADTSYDKAVEVLDGTRETVPSLTASPNAKKHQGGKSAKLQQPNISPLPETLDVPQKGVNLTEEQMQSAEYQPIDATTAMRAFTGK